MTGALWKELIDVVQYWVDVGVKIFRVDNPHTKPVAFWEELIATIQRKDPDVLFLAEAFHQAKMMQVLGKVGFTQSYTYFTWREDRHALTEYATELTRSDMRWYYRANFWPNTPDILPEHLQNAGPQMFRIRAALAATMSSTWGMYSGYELCENDPYPGKEEYNHSEKYELKQRDYNKPGNITAFIRTLNLIRRDNPALHLYDNLSFHGSDHGQILCYSKVTPDFSNRILCIDQPRRPPCRQRHGASRSRRAGTRRQPPVQGHRPHAQPELRVAWCGQLRLAQSKRRVDAHLQGGAVI
jgi:starch synthase (maltosyl-transferring)